MSAPTALSSRDVAIGVACLAWTSLVWGVNWPIMKIGLTEIPPWTFRALMAPGAGLFLFLLTRLTGDSLFVPRHERRTLVMTAMFNVALWQLCSGFGVSLMASGRASILAFTMPVWAAVIGLFVLGETITRRRVAALAFGMGGIAVLVSADGGLDRDALPGTLFMIAAAMSWALGTVLVKRAGFSIPIVTLTAWQLILGGVPMTIGAVILESPDLSTVSLVAWGTVAFNVFFAVSLGMFGFLKALSIFSAGASAIGTLMVPVVGTLSAALILDEPLGWREVTALALVSIALILVMTRIGARRPGP